MCLRPRNPKRQSNSCEHQTHDHCDINNSNCAWHWLSIRQFRTARNFSCRSACSPCAVHDRFHRRLGASTHTGCLWRIWQTEIEWNAQLYACSFQRNVDGYRWLNLSYLKPQRCSAVSAGFLDRFTVPDSCSSTVTLRRRSEITLILRHRITTRIRSLLASSLKILPSQNEDAKSKSFVDVVLSSEVGNEIEALHRLQPFRQPHNLENGETNK